MKLSMHLICTGSQNFDKLRSFLNAKDLIFSDGNVTCKISINDYRTFSSEVPYGGSSSTDNCAILDGTLEMNLLSDKGDVVLHAAELVPLVTDFLLENFANPDSCHTHFSPTGGSKSIFILSKRLELGALCEWSLVKSNEINAISEMIRDFMWAEFFGCDKFDRISTKECVAIYRSSVLELWQTFKYVIFDEF